MEFDKLCSVFLEQFSVYTPGGKVVVVFPGRFQPAHRGHYAVYRELQRKFPEADVYIATTGKVDVKSPFTFDERKSILEFMGIPADAIVSVLSPYDASEITSNYNANTDFLIYALSEKDANRLTMGTKKNGQLTYLQQLPSDTDNLEPFITHGYVYITSIKPFTVLGKIIEGATAIREVYLNSSIDDKKQIIVDLYGRFSVYIFNLFNLKLG